MRWWACEGMNHRFASSPPYKPATGGLATTLHAECRVMHAGRLVAAEERLALASASTSYDLVLVFNDAVRPVRDDLAVDPEEEPERVSYLLRIIVLCA